MSNFKDYFYSQHSEDKTMSTVAASISSVMGLASAMGGISLSKNQQDEFSNKVSSLTHSEEFIGELSSTIGEPLSNESEDEFVNRAKDAMKKLLQQKLKK